MPEVSINESAFASGDSRIKDKFWRLNHLYVIKDQQGRKVQFKMNRAQIDYFYRTHTRNIILKSRQLGFTTFEAIDCLDDVLFNPNFNALMLNYEKTQAEGTFREKIQFAWDNFPDIMKQFYSVDTQRANQLTFGFGDGSSSTIAVRVSGRSGTNNRVHVSEFAKMCILYPSRAIEVIDGTIPSVPLSGRVDIESTAEGSDGLFYKMFWDAWARKDYDRPLLSTEFKAHFYNWRWDDKELDTISHIIPHSEMDEAETFIEYQKKYDLTDRELTYYYMKWVASQKKWNIMYQNYPTTPEEAFVGSGHKMFDVEKLDLLKATIKKPLVVRDSWVFYEPYIEGHYYCAGVDVAEGVGQDSSTVVILDVTGTKARVVATFASNTTPPDILAYEIVNGCRVYGEPIVAVERNNNGGTTLSVLKGIYGNIYTVVEEDKVADRVTEKLGWWTSGVSKPKMFFELADAINEQLIHIASPSLLEELRTYDKEDLRRTKFNPEATNHWDLLMALAIAYQMKTFAYGSGDMEIY